MDDGEMAKKLDEETVFRNIVSGLNDANSYEKKGTGNT
jgi:hypothetical protein